MNTKLEQRGGNKMTYVIALNNGKCSCTWDYVKNQNGEIREFETKEEAHTILVDQNYNGAVIKL